MSVTEGRETDESSRSVTEGRLRQSDVSHCGENETV